MNVTLIYPLLSRDRSRIDENKQYWPPLGLAYIADVLTPLFLMFTAMGMGKIFCLRDDPISYNNE